MHIYIPVSAGLCIRDVAVLILYCVLALLCIENAPFLHDDGLWVWAASQIADGKQFFAGCPSSRGVGIHSPLGAYIYACFYMIHADIYLVIAGVLLLNVCTQWIIIRLGRALENPQWGYAASLLFFFSPSFFVFIAPRTWQVTCLPFFSAGMLYCLVKFTTGQGRWWHLTLACACWALAMHLHPTAVFLGPVLFSALLFKNVLSRITLRQYLVSISVLLCSPIHLVYYFVSTGKAAQVLCAYVLVVLFFLALRKAIMAIPAWIDARKVEYPLVLFLVIAALGTFFVLWMLFPGNDMPGLIIKYFEVLAANSAWLAKVTGVDTGAGWKALVFGTTLSAEALLWILYMLKSLKNYHALSDGEKIVWMANAFPAAVLLLLPAVIQTEWDFYWPYMLFMFPAPFLGISRLLVGKSAHGKRKQSSLTATRLVLLSMVVSFTIAMTVYFSLHVKKTGGRNLYFSNIGLKKQVMAYIYENSADPCIILVLDTSSLTNIVGGIQGLLGWRMVALETAAAHHKQSLPTPEKTTTANRQRYFYIMEKYGLFMESPRQISARIKHGGTVQQRQFKSVTVYRTDFYDPAVGRALGFLTYESMCKLFFFGDDQ